METKPAASRSPHPDSSADPQTALTGAGFVVISAFCFGAVAVLAKIAYDAGSNAPTSLVLRFGLAAAIFWIILAARGRVQRLPRRRIAGFALMGLMFSGSSTTSFMAIERIPASLAILVLYIYPAFITLGSAVVFKTRFQPSRLLVLVATMTGCVLTVDPQGGDVNLLGLGLALSGAVFYAAYVLLGSRITVGVPPLNSSAWIITFAGGMLLVVGAAGLFGDSFNTSISTRGWLAILALAIISTVIAISTFLAGVVRIDVFRASIISTIEPVVTVILAALLLSERLTLQQSIGGLIIIGSAIALQVISQREGRRLRTTSANL